MSSKHVLIKNNSSDVTKEQLIADFKVVLSDAEALIKATANQGGEALATVRGKAVESLAVAKEKLADVEASVIARTEAAVEAADVYVRENPWQAVGVGAGLGVLIGFLIARR
jgi:ElaB/YqjD/DUF883 family membrane-anchored ribosome-binding protein